MRGRVIRLPIKLDVVLWILSALLFFLGIALLVPALVGLLYGNEDWWTFGVIGLGSVLAGFPGWRFTRHSLGMQEVQIREGFLIVGFSWLVLALVGAIPFWWGGVFATYTDAFFETMSGFTTTGASVLGGPENPQIESVPEAFLLWRSMTQWLGGMGIIVLTLAILPILGVGGMQLYKAEVPGPSADKLTPRIRETAKRLWFVYVGLTLAQMVLLAPAMGPFDAANHALTTLSTGGFSTRDASVAAYGSPYVEWIITLFMFLGGVNFALHYRMLRGKSALVWRDTEFRAYAIGLLVAALLITAGLWVRTIGLLPGGISGEVFQGYDGFLESLRYAAFQTVSIVTTTGFATADYEFWPALASGILFLLFFTGGMAGSTAGGIKVMRHVLLIKNSFRELRQLIHPQGVLPVRLNDRVVAVDVMRNVLSFAVLYFALIATGTGMLAWFGIDMLSAFGAAASSVGNIGPAFGTVGPAENYAHFPAQAKWTLAFLMMAGRLEIFTVLILFTPAFWKR